MNFVVSIFVVLLVLLLPCSVLSQISDRISTLEDRAALFDYLLMKTMEREAFSPIKNHSLQLDIEKEMLRYKEEMIAADTDEKLFYALIKISNARKDRHLRVNLINGGLKVNRFETKYAPVRFSADYGTSGKYFVFVSDYTENIKDYAGKNMPKIGDKLVSINQQSFAEYFARIEPYHRYSTVNGLWWKFAEALNQRSYVFPPHFYREEVTYQLERKNGEEYSIVLPYLNKNEIKWKGIWKIHGMDRYPDFSLVFSTQTYDLYKHDDGKEVLLLDWYGFRENLVRDMNQLVEYASKKQLLDYAIIWDGTRSRGGSKGAYAIQHLSPKRFKTTFGNIRLSDITEVFVKQKRSDYNQKQINDSGVSETVDDGSWLIDWLENDVLLGLQAGQNYSNNVPFKLAHLPKWSDGIIEPAPDHFTGPLVVLLSPQGGSHLDQFASIVVDNGLAHTIGMPAGGYSNTWEWEEEIVFPISKKLVVEYMWSIGHTIRPNGQILEGNPALVSEYIPLTRDNYLNYYEILLSRALKHLELE